VPLRICHFLPQVKFQGQSIKDGWDSPAVGCQHRLSPSFAGQLTSKPHRIGWVLKGEFNLYCQESRKKGYCLQPTRLPIYWYQQHFCVGGRNKTDPSKKPPSLEECAVCIFFFTSPKHLCQ